MKYRKLASLIALIAIVLVYKLVFDSMFTPDAATGIAQATTALGTGALTMADWAKRMEPDNKVAKVIELLSQRNEIMEDMLWKEGNLPTGNRSTVRTSLPTVNWRKVNQGVSPSKSTTAQIDDQTAMLEAWCEVDCKLVELAPNPAALRLSEASAFLEAMAQEMASTIFYGNGALNPEEFTGLAPRYGSIGDNVIDAGGRSTDNTSIWLVAWGEETICGLFPRGSQAGVQHNDYGEVTVEVTAGIAGQRMRAFQDRYLWEAGLAVKDYRHAVRIANIDVSDLTGATPADLLTFMEQADEIIPNDLGRRVFYVNRRVSRWLRNQVRGSVETGGGITFENFAGKRVMTFGGVPIRRVDALLLNETPYLT